MATVIEDSSIDFERYLAGSEISARMRPAAAYRDRVKQRFAVGVRHVGMPAPWAKTQDKVRFREGEVTVWAGVNGSGKSMLLGQVVMGFMRAQRCAIASFEMAPETTLQRMCRQASQGPRPTPEFIDQFHDWTDARLWLYDHRGRIDPRHMLAVCRHAHAELGIRHLVIDSLMKVVRGEDDYNGQKDLVNDLCAIAGETGMHVHLVHHLRKGDGSGKPGSKDDLKGSGAVSDQVDNVVIVWRRRPRIGAEAVEPSDDSPDAMLIVEKQRNGEWEGRVGLWFDPDSMQFLEGPWAHTVDFVGAPGLALVQAS